MFAPEATRSPFLLHRSGLRTKIFSAPKRDQKNDSSAADCRKIRQLFRLISSAFSELFLVQIFTISGMSIAKSAPGQKGLLAGDYLGELQQYRNKKTYSYEDQSK
jgi:hypothetical protein